MKVIKHDLPQFETLEIYPLADVHNRKRSKGIDITKGVRRGALRQIKWG